MVSNREVYGVFDDDLVNPLLAASKTRYQLGLDEAFDIEDDHIHQLNMRCAAYVQLPFVKISQNLRFKCWAVMVQIAGMAFIAKSWNVS